MCRCGATDGRTITLTVARAVRNACRTSISFACCLLPLRRCRAVQHNSRSGGAIEPQLEFQLTTDLSVHNILSGATDIAALVALQVSIPRATIRFLPSLHAKVYIADAKQAVVTSSNLTDNGLMRNFEYGVFFDDEAAVMRIREDVLRYSSLGSQVGPEQLQRMSAVASEVREVSREMERSVRRQLRTEFNRRLSIADAEFLRARTAGRTAHAIFADAIVHLLSSGPVTTVELNRRIQQIHPDLCNDNVDRVIDGEHFGKRWKHGVRTAQVSLRRAGRIRRTERLWQLVT